MTTPEEEEETSPLSHEQIIRIGEHRYLQRRYFRNYALLSMAAQVDSKQGDALVALYYMREAGIETTVGNLAQQMQVVSHTTTSLLNSLEREGLIERERELEGDYRKKHIRFTQEGESKARALTQATFRVFETFVPLLLASLEATWKTMVEDGLENE